MSGARRGRIPLFVAPVLTVIALGTTGASAATIAPNTTTDVVGNDGACSLREAITAAFTHLPSGAKLGECAAGSGNDIIQLQAGHYILSLAGAGEDANASGDLDIRSDLRIQGAGAAATTIDANQIDRVIQVLKGVTATIAGVTITGGRTPDGANASKVVKSTETAIGEAGGSAEGGGGIFDLGTLTVAESVISANTTGAGGHGGLAVGELGGRAFGGGGGHGGDGGAIAATGPLTILNSTITANSTGFGGSGSSGDGGASTTEGAMGGEADGGDGGRGGDAAGVYAEGPLTIRDSTISHGTGGNGGPAGDGVGGDGAPGGTGGNGGPGRGGDGGDGGGTTAVEALDGVEMTGSTIADNAAGNGAPGARGFGAGGGGGSGGGNGGKGGEAQGGEGGRGGFVGGMFVEQLPGRPALVENTTVVGNRSGMGGAGESALGGNGGGAVGGGSQGKGGNSRGGPGGAGGDGGGLMTESESGPELVQDTISGNESGTGGAAGPAGEGGNPGGSATPGVAGKNALGGGVFAYGDATLADSIVASNSGGNCSTGTTGHVDDGGHDISFGDATCPGANVDPQLGPLKDNGGPTATEAIGAGSPALDAVPATGAGCPASDQRGVLRPAGAACDIGAFELATATATTAPASGTLTTSATLHGSARNPDLAGATALFEYGPTTAYGAQTKTLAVAARSAGGAFNMALSGLKPNRTYHFRAVVLNSIGKAFGADLTFRTSSNLPALSALRIHPSRIRPEGGRGPTTRAKLRHHRGATITYKDSMAAATTLKVQQSLAGFRSGKRCTAKRPAHHKGRVKRCTRYVTRGTFTHTDRVGANRINFTGRIAGHALKPGRYRLQLTPRAGGMLGRSATVAFRVL